MIRAKGEGAPEVPPVPVSSPLFRPYGDVVRLGDAARRPVNAGTAWRHDVADFGSDERPGSRLIVSVFEAKPQRLPRAVSLLERHPCSRQAIVPLGEAAFVFLVALAGSDERPDMTTLKAFHCPPSSGVIYGRGVWHSPIIGLHRTGLFLVQSWQDGTATDCEEVAIPAHIVTAV